MQTRTMPHDDRLPFHRANLPPKAGARLLQKRRATGRTRRAVAGEAGLAPRTLARIERCQQAPQWITVKRLCDVLGMDPYSVAPRWDSDSYDVPIDHEAVPGLGLRALRRARGMTLRQLSEATGISIPTLSRYERGLIASRLLGGRQDQPAVPYSERDLLLENDRVAFALGCRDSEALRKACDRAARGRPIEADGEDG